MDGISRRAFQAIYLRFVERVDPIQLLCYITSLSEHTRDIIRNSQTCHSGSRCLAAQKLFEALKCRPDGFQQAAYALRQSGHEDLANVLQPQQGEASAHDHTQYPQRSHSILQPPTANFPPIGANSPNFQRSYHGIQMAGASIINQNPASFSPNAPSRNGAPNSPDCSHRCQNSCASKRNQNPTPFQPYVPGRATVPNFQDRNMSATYMYMGASNVGLPLPTRSMSQQPQQGVNPLQQQAYSQHQPVTMLYERNTQSAHSVAVGLPQPTWSLSQQPNSQSSSDNTRNRYIDETGYLNQDSFQKALTLTTDAMFVGSEILTHETAPKKLFEVAHHDKTTENENFQDSYRKELNQDCTATITSSQHPQDEVILNNFHQTNTPGKLWDDWKMVENEYPCQESLVKIKPPIRGLHISTHETENLPVNIVLSDSDNEIYDSGEMSKREEYISNIPDFQGNNNLNTPEIPYYKPALKDKVVYKEKSARQSTECLGKFHVSQITGLDYDQTKLKTLALEEDSPIASQSRHSDKSIGSAKAEFDSNATSPKLLALSAKLNDGPYCGGKTKLSLRSEVVKEIFVQCIESKSVEDIRQECFSDVYTDSLFSMASDMSADMPTEDHTAENVPAGRNEEFNIDHSMEDVKIPEMRCLRDDDELNSITRKKYKACEFGIISYNGEDEVSEGSLSGVNSDDDIIITDAFPTTEGNTLGADIIRRTQRPPLDTSAQSAGEERVLDDIGQRPYAAVNVRAENSLYEHLTSMIILGSIHAYRILFPDV